MCDIDIAVGCLSSLTQFMVLCTLQWGCSGLLDCLPSLYTVTLPSYFFNLNWYYYCTEYAGRYVHISFTSSRTFQPLWYGLQPVAVPNTSIIIDVTRLYDFASSILLKWLQTLSHMWRNRFHRLNPSLRFYWNRAEYWLSIPIWRRSQEQSCSTPVSTNIHIYSVSLKRLSKLA